MELKRNDQVGEIATIARAIPPGATTVLPVDGVIQLPPGTRLDAIKLSGNDLLVTLPDGQVLVIVDGALRIPQIKIGPINIPAPTVAALIAGQEPEPAAGRPQSSGGNFAQTPGDIGDPFGLGDLLPPTEFGFPRILDIEVIPDAVDDKPRILITTPDQTVGVTAATAIVSEAALAARGAEPAGTDPASPRESTSGTIQIAALDQPVVVAVNGTTVTTVGQVIATPLGQITITSITPGLIGYSYTLTDNSTDPVATDVVTITVTDSDGDVGTATLTLTIEDDAPIARNDVDDTEPGSRLPQAGNVITGDGTASGADGADSPGADGAIITGVRGGSATEFSATGAPVQGQYGRLVIAPDGTYAYVRSAGTPGGVEDVFTYQLTDGDGDVSTATLTIRIGDSTPSLLLPMAGDDGTFVDEAGLPERDGESPGSREGDGSDFTFGVIQFAAGDGPAALTINGVAVTEEGQEIELATGTFYIIAINPDSIEYFFWLTDNTIGDNTSQLITVGITDLDGDNVTASFEIDIIDDVPEAVADFDSIAAGTFGPATGNVITDAENDGGRDFPGADGVSVSLVSGAGDPVAAGTPVVGLYGVLTLNSDGSYSYVRNPGSPGGVFDVFTYQLIDGDGDTSTATLSIAIGDGRVTLTLPDGDDDGQLVSEAGLPLGSAPDSGTATTTGSFTFSTADGLGSVRINGEQITAIGQTIAGEFGTLTITSISATAIGYSYTLTDVTNGDDVAENFGVVVTDVDGDSANGSLSITVEDDVPTAIDDLDSLQSGSGPSADGNVLTGVGGDDANASDGEADVQGADGSSVTAIAFGGDSGEINGLTFGAYGTLAIAADGSYLYTLDPDNAEVAGLDGDDELTETFEYVITDADGDEATATLTVVIRGRDDIVTINGLSPEGAEATVAEANLADGSAPDNDALIQTGEFSFDAADGIAAITIAGETLFDGAIVAGLVITTDLGILTIVDFVPVFDAAGDIVGGTISYSYELTDNSLLHSGSTAAALTESFAIEITDSDGTVAAATLDVLILDDNPAAEADEGDVGEGQTLEVDAASGLLANDTAGADGAEILGVRAVGDNPSAPAMGGVGAAIVGLYGELTVAADGSYSYVANPNTVPPDGAEDVFVYTLADGDGDPSTTTLTIRLSDAGLSADTVLLLVNEAALPTGSDADSDAETVFGDLNENVAGGTGPFEFVLTGDGIGTHGTLTLNADGSYIYTLTSAVAGALADNGTNVVPAVETFTYNVTDAFGNVTQNVIVIDVIDDVPVARSEPSIMVAEDAAAISGNLLANDTSGADGATVTSVTIGSAVVAVAATGITTISNANGTYSFQANGAWSFDPVPQISVLPIHANFTYTITDGDGDQSSAVQLIRLTDGTEPTASDPIQLTVDDQHLESGSTPSPMQPVSASGNIVFTPGSDAIASIGFGDISTLDGGLSWTLESDNQIIGWDADENPVVVIDLSLSGDVATVTVTLQYNYGLHPDVTIDDLSELGFIEVVATDADGDQVAGTVNISVSDDVPSITALSSPAGLLTVDETNLDLDATANFASLFNIVIGADQDGSTVSYAFEVTTASGLVDVETGSKIILQTIGNTVEGRLQDSPSIVAFRLTVANNGQATLDQIRAVRHPDASNPDDPVTLSSTLIRLIATVTDGDGDQASALVAIGNTLVFKDDGPSIVATNVDTNAITLTTQDADTRGSAFDVATANLSAAFSTSLVNFGADGPADAGAVTWTYSLALGSAAATSALTSNGVPVTLALVSGEIVGSAAGTPIFSIAVNAATGVVTLTQFAEIDHPLPGSSSNYAAQLVELAANLVELRGTATIVDRDGDSVSDTVAVDLGGNIRFADDGPSITAGGTGSTLTVDESDFATDATVNLSGLFNATTDFGADGPGFVTYELGVTAGASGLIDSLTGEPVILSIEGGVIFGRTSTHEVFRISVAPGGLVTFDQSRAILHTPDSGPDQTKFLSGSNLITLTAIATDGDGDTARATADITGQFAIRDDTPQAVHDEDNVSRDGEIFADGNVLTGIGGTDVNGMDGSPDNGGADGGLTVTGVAFGATTGTIGAALAGDYGSIVIAADGSYRYDLDPNDPAVIALNSSETLTDTFLYTVHDADGDTSVATITISITGANDFPIARADTNWVLDGPSGSDPSATGNVLQDIAHPGAPFGIFADVADNDPDLEAITVTSAGTYVGLYGTLVINPNGSYTYTLDEDKPVVNALDSGQTLTESFAYTISDGSLSVGSTLTITVFGSNDAPTIGTAIARVSEEGLPNGLPDTAPNATLDTTNSTTFSGTLAIGDADAGETFTATLGNPGAVLTAGGVPVTWAGVGTGTLIGSVGGSEVIRVTLASNGAYTVTLSRAVDHPNVTLEDLKDFFVPVSVSDGTTTTTNATAIQVVIEDDAPTATGETGATSQPMQDVNTLFILDFSDSIDDGELNVMLEAVQGALAQLDSSASGALTIKFVIFSSGSFASEAFTTAADANAYLDSLNPAAGGERPSEDDIGLNTNYTGAIETALANFDTIPGASNQVFFLSDGNPNQSVQIEISGIPPSLSVSNSLALATATAWNNFVDNNNVNVTAIGIDNNPLQPLNIQRLRDIDVNAAPDNEPILVDDFEDLVATLLAVIVPSAVSGDLDANDFFGADGGRLLSITIGTTTYTWDGASNIEVSSGGSIVGTALNAITTPMGGTLTLNFATGQYNYQPPSPITVTATEVFNYVVTDRDGDTATANLSVTITALAPPIAVDLDGDGVEFVSNAAGVSFDYNGDGFAETTAWVGAEDGLLAIDKNGDGKVNNGAELVFGGAGLSDLQGLAAAYDSNVDGKLDAADTDFAKFGIWQDANSNGVTDAGEFRSLISEGIISIALTSDGRAYTAADGQVQVKGEALYTRADGGTGKLADAAFATNFADQQRMAATNGAAGVSTAMLVAGLAAATPLAARSPATPNGDNSVANQQVGVSSEAAAQSDALPAAKADGLVHEYFSGPATARIEPENAQRQMDEDDRREAQSDPSDSAAPDPTYLELLAGTEVDLPPEPATATAASDQMQMALPPQAVTDPAAAQLDTIVAAALEGPQVELDALLGPATPAEPVLARIMLGDGGAVGVLGDGASGQSFIADLAQQHVVVQLEQMASAGHA
ncbi:MAG: VCBS domain-containing protein [Alphaproteobacteria bacterium]|nr:VCBS domain-containing protein [Alphaproteobacteria bacterium]MBU1825197.1 VCBS domain-containing protein [Alphaproteobacteria bacterium]